MRVALILKTLRDRWKSAAAWALAMVALCSVQLYIYPSIRESGDAMNKFLDAFPKELITMFRIENYTSAVGFLGTELFSMMLPLVFIAVGSSWGAAAAAEEEQSGTSEIIYALPISRTKVLLSKLAATWIALVLMALTAIVVISIGAALVDLDISDVELLAATAACFALGLFFNALAMAVSALSAKRGLGLAAAIAVALLSFLIFSLAPMVDTFDDILPVIPFNWALGENPLKTGFDWLGLLWLLLGSAIGYALSIISINRRDLDA